MSEGDFVRELCHCVNIVLNRIEKSWSSYRALHACIAVTSYVVQNAPINVSSEAWNLLVRCRKMAISWSDAMEKLIEFQELPNQDLVKKNWFINGIIVLTFGTYTGFTSKNEYEDVLDQNALCTLMRARISMFERGDVSSKDFETKRLDCICYRIIVKWEERVLKMLTKSSETLTHIVRERWDIKEISWKLGPDNFFEGKCVTLDGSLSIIHIHVT